MRLNVENHIAPCSSYDMNWNASLTEGVSVAIGRHQRVLAMLLIVFACFPATGCVNLAANLIRAVYGNNRPAEFDGMQGKKVAVVCTSDSGLGGDMTSASLTRYVQALLRNNVKEITIVRQQEVENWLDEHGWTESDYLEIGRGVDADQVLAIDLTNLSLRNGATLFQGNADITVTVYDAEKDGEILYRKYMPEFAFPSMGGPSITDTTEVKFRAAFLQVVAQKVAGLFYPVDVTSDFALDATASSL